MNAGPFLTVNAEPLPTVIAEPLLTVKTSKKNKLRSHHADMAAAAFYRMENRIECSHACGDESGQLTPLSNRALAISELRRSLIERSTAIVLGFIYLGMPSTEPRSLGPTSSGS